MKAFLDPRTDGSVVPQALAIMDGEQKIAFRHSCEPHSGLRERVLTIEQSTCTGGGSQNSRHCDDEELEVSMKVVGKRSLDSRGGKRSR